MVLLRLTGGAQCPVIVQNRFRKARRAGGEIDRRVVVLTQRHWRRTGRTETHQLQAVLRVIRSSLPREKHHPDPRQIIRNAVHPLDKLRPEHQHLHIGKLQTIFDFLRRIAEVQRHRHTASLQNAKINGQPFQTVHHQNAHLCLLLHPAGQKQIGKTVCPSVKVSPAQLSPIRRTVSRTLDQACLPPCHRAVALLGRIQLYKRRIRTVQTGVALQKLRDYHFSSSSSVPSHIICYYIFIQAIQTDFPLCPCQSRPLTARLHMRSPQRAPHRCPAHPGYPPSKARWCARFSDKLPQRSDALPLRAQEK